MTEHNFEQMRRAMVASQLRTTGVNDPRVVAAMGAVPRERFVPRDRASLAYADATVPLANGRKLNTPMAVGKLLTELRPAEGERALVVAAASGYAAALLARLVGSVVAVEEDPDLAGEARAALAGTDVKIVEGPLAEGYQPRAPYDLIYIDGAVEFVPQALVQQLGPNGRLGAAVVDQGVTRLALGRRGGSGFGMLAFADAEAVLLPAFTKPRGFSF